MEKGLISKIQRYSTKDGPGIRTTVFMVGCNLKCKWCANPELIDPGKKLLYYEAKCVHCGRCTKVASNNSITLKNGKLLIDRTKLDNIVQVEEECLEGAMEIIGEEYTSKMLFDLLIKDEVFYKKSGGGVTFSGGEAALSDKFIIEVTDMLHELNISVALDTAGNIEIKRFIKLVEKVDIVLYDIKTYDKNMHQNCTGVSNELILKNAVELSKMHKNMIIRMVIVPTQNDDFEDIKKRANFIKNLGESVLQVDVLPYHKLGLGKYLSLNKKYEFNNISESKEAVNKTVEYLESLGLKVTIGG